MFAIEWLLMEEKYCSLFSPFVWKLRLHFRWCYFTGVFFFYKPHSHLRQSYVSFPSILAAHQTVPRARKFGVHFFLRFGAHHTQHPRGSWQSGQCPLHTHLDHAPSNTSVKDACNNNTRAWKEKKTLAQTEQQPHKRQKPIPIKREHNHKRDSVWESVEGTGERAHWLKWCTNRVCHIRSVTVTTFACCGHAFLLFSRSALQTPCPV